MSAGIGWSLISAGIVAGAIIGLLAQRDDWLGGYSSRPRRLLRLGHIALVALGGLNVFWPLTEAAREASPLAPVVAVAFAAGGLTMGPVCFLAAAWWQSRILFVIPSASLLAGAMLAAWESFQ